PGPRAPRRGGRPRGGGAGSPPSRRCRGVRAPSSSGSPRPGGPGGRARRPPSRAAGHGAGHAAGEGRGQDGPVPPDTLLAEVVATTEAVVATRARSAKVAALADLLARLRGAELPAGVGVLIPPPRQGPT